MEPAAFKSVRKEKGRDDAHGLLRVIAAMAQAVGAGGNELHMTEKLVHPIGARFQEGPGDNQDQQQSEQEAGGG